MRRSAVYKLLASATAASLLCLSCVVVWLVYALARAPMTETDVTWRIPPGMSFQKLAQELEEESYISSKWLLRAYRFWRGGRNKPIRMGDYRIQAGMLPGDFLDMIEEGRVLYYSFSIIPGSTFEQILRTLRSLDNIRQELPADVDVNNVMGYVGAADYSNFHGEGMFYADTYHYHSGSSDIDLLSIAHKLLLQRLGEHCGELPEHISSDYEALILASIVERESGSLEEQKVISAVFLNRLGLNMRLEADPTVIYGLGSRYQGDIKKVHLRSDTAYNTYTRRGLPPTPIANVWQESLRSVCQPVSHDYLYFVADGRGGHVFSVDYDSHLKAVRQYIRYQKTLK